MSDRPAMTRRQLREQRHNGQSTMPDAQNDVHEGSGHSTSAEAAAETVFTDPQPTRSTPVVDTEGHVIGAAGMTRRELRILRESAAKKLEQGESVDQVAEEISEESTKIQLPAPSASETPAVAEAPSDDDTASAADGLSATEPAVAEPEAAAEPQPEAQETIPEQPTTPVVDEADPVQPATVAMPVAEVAAETATADAPIVAEPLIPEAEATTDHATESETTDPESTAAEAIAEVAEPEAPRKKKHWWNFGSKKAESVAESKSEVAAGDQVEQASEDVAETAADAAQADPSVTQLLPNVAHSTGPIIAGALLSDVAAKPAENATKDAEPEQVADQTDTAAEEPAVVETETVDASADSAADAVAPDIADSGDIDAGTSTEPNEPEPTDAEPVDAETTDAAAEADNESGEAQLADATTPVADDVFDKPTAAIDLSALQNPVVQPQDSPISLTQPEGDLLAAPLHKTGEVILSTGTITLPDSMSQTGRLALQFDPGEIPSGHDHGDFATAEIKPVSARDAVASLDGNTVIPKQAGSSNGVTIALAIIAGVLLIAAAGVLVANLLVQNGGI